MDDLALTEILLVEDNPTDAEMTVRALKHHRLAARVEWLKDGAEAIDYMLRRGNYAARAKGNPQLILLDLKMPRLDGIDVLRILKAEPATNMVPVVMFTSSDEENDIARSYDLGVNSYVVKPVEFEKFVDAVSKLGVYWTLMNKMPRPA